MFKSRNLSGYGIEINWVNLTRKIRSKPICGSLHWSDILTQSLHEKYCVWTSKLQCTSENSATSQTLAFMGHEKGQTKTGWGERLFLVSVGTASQGWWTGKLLPGCLAATWQTSLSKEGLHLVHWGELSTSWPDGNWNNSKFYKGLKGIEIVLAPCNIIILDKLDKTVKIRYIY